MAHGGKFIFPRKFLAMVLLVFCLNSCGGEDHPLSFGVNSPPLPGGPNPGSSGNGPVGGQACAVQFKTQLQLKASANPLNASGPFEILDANPFVVSAPIPIQINGNNLTIDGNQFSAIYFRPPETAADLKITVAPDSKIQGTYQPDSGEIQFSSVSFVLEIVKKGGTDNFIPGKFNFSPVDLGTGSVTVKGNLHSITETGQALRKEDKTTVLVFGMVLPNEFGPLTPLNNMIGGGALTGRFEGALDQLPENCTAGGGSFPTTSDQPKDLNISIENQTFVSKIDFGTTLVIPRKIDGQEMLDCTAAENRGLIAKKVTIKNTGSTTRTFRLPQPTDTDGDKKSPLCSGGAEFVRGSISTQGVASCKTVTVAGKTFATDECLIPGNDPNSSISFPLLYVPFNFQTVPAGKDPPTDTGKFSIEYGEDKPFEIELVGRSAPDFRDVFSVAKKNDGKISSKDIHNKGVLKIATDKGESFPFTQKMVLRNASPDVWQKVTFSLAKGKNFSIKNLSGTDLPNADGGDFGLLEFDLVFDPEGQTIVQDALTIKMVKALSVTADNPGGFQTQIQIQLLGTVGIAPISGEVEMYFDYFTALIDHVALSEPIESNDFRPIPDLAPAPLKIHFSNTEDEFIKTFAIEPNNIDITAPGVTAKDRQKVLRIFTARASIGKDGDRLDPGDSADKCNEPENINQPYQNGDCSYFYWTDLQADTGYYDDESGHLIMPQMHLSMDNPYHADIFGIWPASNPFHNPDYLLKTPLTITFTTQILNRRIFDEGGLEIPLVVDERISISDLIVRDKRLGLECPPGFMDNAFPHLKCYLSSDGRYLEGREVALRPGKKNEYDIILVGVGQFQPGTTDPDIPWFLGDNGGSRIYIAIQARLIPVSKIIFPISPSSKNL